MKTVFSLVLCGFSCSFSLLIVKTVNNEGYLYWFEWTVNLIKHFLYIACVKFFPFLKLSMDFFKLKSCGR
jgi:hypothetical protein